MAESFHRLRSKLNRAIVAYLVSASATSPDIGGEANISPENDFGTKGYPNTTVHATMSTPEVQMTGLRRIRTLITIKGRLKKEDESLRLAFDKRVAATQDALMLSDDGQTLGYTAAAITAAGRALAVSDPTNNADMADFTCQAIYDAGEGDGVPDEEGSAAVEVLMFDIVCSPSNVD